MIAISTKRSIGYAEHNGNSLHVYSDFLDDSKLLHIDLEGPDLLAVNITVPAELWRLFQQDLADAAKELDNLRREASR